MNTATYASVLDRIASYLGEADGLTAEDQTLCAAKINLCVRLAWQHYFWPDLMLIEERTLRAEYSASENVAAPTATAAVERYFAGDGEYYQTLVAQSPAAQAPATYSGGTWTENSAYWAKCQASYSGDDWADATAYALADIVRNASNGRYYQCHTAHTSSGSLDTTKFGILTPFIRSLSYTQTGETVIGDIKAIYDAHPEYVLNAQRVGGGRGPDFRHRGSYAQVLGCANLLYVEFRRRPNVFSGAVRADDETYASGVTRYDEATGDYYTSNTSIAAGESPTLAPSKWDLVEFPEIFAEYVAQSVYAMLTNKEQELPENFNVQRTAGYPLLLQELDKLERQQGQTRQLNVVLR